MTRLICRTSADLHIQVTTAFRGQDIIIIRRHEDERNYIYEVEK